MGQRQAYITLDSCITDYLGESEQSIHRYKKCFDIAFRGLDNMGIDFFYQIQTVKLPINANGTVTLPSNCLNVIKAGILNGAGEIAPLNSNSKLTTYADLLPDRIAKTQGNSIPNWDINCNGGWYYNYWANGGYTNLYGLPSGAPFIGSYKYDSFNGVIVLDANFQFDYLMVECLVSPIEGQEYYIPIQFREALIAWMAWLDIRNIPSSRRGNLGDKRDRRAEFYNQRRLAKAQYNPFDINAAYQASLEQIRSTVKG
ncbi:MAG TPA: hypothetical protein VIM07_04400 [Chitinophagaceae bacterium]